jgi:hypothetical protein
VPLPHAVAEEGAAHVHVLVLVVDAHLKLDAQRGQADGDALDRLIRLHAAEKSALNVMAARFANS